MSIVRRSEGSDIYIYEIKGGMFVCDNNTNHHKDEAILGSKKAVLAHAVWHKCKGDKVPLKDIISDLITR